MAAATARPRTPGSCTFSTHAIAAARHVVPAPGSNMWLPRLMSVDAGEVMNWVLRAHRAEFALET